MKMTIKLNTSLGMLLLIRASYESIWESYFTGIFSVKMVYKWVWGGALGEPPRIEFCRVPPGIYE